jgi:uncharacterized RDD family membrane protein YckC
MTVTCPHCGFSREIEEDLSTEGPFHLSCPQCGGAFRIEAQNPAEETELPFEEPERREPEAGPSAPPPATPEALPKAGFWVRVVAAVTDLLLISVIDSVASLLFGMALRLVADPGTADETLQTTVTTLFGSIILIAYYVFFTGYGGQTPGKMAIRVKVVRTDGSDVGFGRAFLREVIGKLLSWILFGIGYLMVAFDPRKQGLHDKIADTYVVKI